ncbi:MULTISPECIES: peptidylprolyl isomerase [unclassified Haematospirillum]|uniref:peptidylprolyl isomerase n=1 Tax=unclassified Haematospirillum TaxID=2622088 RepID=UPI00143C47DF|nr:MULTISPECIES: peptidylprolyl isomerase [unclassified Haematospirillum]NKD54903.1 hypothetical protein [Haematospirillum sp. H4890]NKD74924.1 hypothetical protein [Haematospirillum sp. H4485]
MIHTTQTTNVALRSRLPVSAIAFCVGLLSVCGSLPAFAVQSGQTQRIAAVVNDEAITWKDVDERTSLLLLTSRLPDNHETRQRIVPRVIQVLVNERLKVQQIKKAGIDVEPADIANAKRQIERNNGFPTGALDDLLKHQGLAPHILETQLRADIGWVRYAQSTLRRQVSVEPAEVDAVISTMKDNLGRPQRLLAEIVLPVTDPAEERQMRALADRLVDQIRQGAPFASLARQFSASVTAAVGGDLGWITTGALEPEIERVLDTMSPGMLSQPVRTTGGYAIMLLRDAREPRKQNPDDIRVQLSQIFMPLSGPAALSEAKRAEIARSVRDTAKSCADIDATAGQLNLPGSGAIGNMRLADLPPPVRAVVRDLPLNTLGGPVEVAGGEAIVMVCDRQDTAGLPPREEIEQRLTLEKLERVSNRALRDLRRSALIDIRR